MSKGRLTPETAKEIGSLGKGIKRTSLNQSLKKYIPKKPHSPDYKAGYEKGYRIGWTAGYRHATKREED